jgi:transcriptional regulator with XRE-family HTH domain
MKKRYRGKDLTWFVAELLKYKRKSLGFSCRIVFEKIGYAQNNLCQLENHEKKPNLETIESLCKCYGMDICQLMHEAKKLLQEYQK